MFKKMFVILCVALASTVFFTISVSANSLTQPAM